MTTKRAPISAQKNIWFDAQQVDNSDLTLEQDYNDTVQSATINNHIGVGVVPEVLVQNILFDSSLVSGVLDGVAIQAQHQPTDNNLGNQLEVTLTDSKVSFRRKVKVAIVGLDFQGNLQYETFVFKANESQISRKHFTRILVLLFNDILGNKDLSLNLGGRVLIKEAQPMSLSRSPIMIAQDQEPNLFFRDFFVDGFLSLGALLKAALPLYNTDTLNINSGNVTQKILLNGDISTQIGEKFIATTNNIQKITLSLSVRNSAAGQQNDLTWNGDLILSIYPLQSSIDSPGDIAPILPIEFSPSNIPLAQVSLNFASLRDSGVLLDSVPQPVDFVFSNSPVASGNVLKVGNYYALALKRSGSANKCDIIIDTGSSVIENSRLTTFTGSLWVDIPEEQLWFQIWTDAAKVADGQAYEGGHGIVIPKTIQNKTTLTTTDYCKDGIQFVGNSIYHAIVSSTTEKSVPIPDQRTGNPVLTRQEYVPNIQLLNNIDITNLEVNSEPLILGAIADKNIKFYDAVSSTIISKLYSATLVNNELLIRIITDPTDTSRYDTSVIGLQSNLLNGDLVGAKIVLNNNNTSVFYRIADARLCTYLLGDVNGDGLITEDDLTLLQSYYGVDLTTGLPLNSIVTTDNVTTTFSNGYITQTQPFTNLFNVNFQLVNPNTNAVLTSGTDGVLVADPTDPRLARFTSGSVNFNNITDLFSYKFVIIAPGTPADYGGFDIVGLDSVSDVISIRKVIYNGDSIAKMLRADINGDFHIDAIDGYLLGKYIDRENLSSSPISTYPSPATNPYTNIGKTFNVIRMRLEQFVDRTDDYTNLFSGRSNALHALPDIFAADGYFFSHNFVTGPVSFSIQKQLIWDESLIVTNNHPKMVPSVFTSTTGFKKNECLHEGIQYSIYGSKPAFDPGKVDVFVPNNLILGDGGEIQRPDGHFYKVDFEVGTIILEIPDGLFGSERTINIMQDFISDYTGMGTTRLGFPAMRFADCSFVKSDALANDQIRFSVSVQSFSPNTNGLDNDGYAGVIVDGKMGVSIDYATGLLTLNFTNLYQDAVLKTLSTKVQIHVFLKKGGFNNRSLFVDSTKVQNMLQLVSVFSGANVGGPSALVQLEADVTGILPIVHGGTGLNDVGPFGSVMTSTGSGVSYQFVNNLINVTPYSLGKVHADKVVKTDGYGFLDPSLYYKNPVYIVAVSGTQSNDKNTPSAIGAFTFRFDKFILEGLESIVLECILETTNLANTAEIQLFNVTTHSYVNLTQSGPVLSTTAEQPTLLRSQDLKTLLSEGATDFIYEIHLSLNPTSASNDTAICKMARLVMTYNNLSLNGSSAIAPPKAHSWNFVPFLPSPTPVS